jgi:hypothetical protein
LKNISVLSMAKAAIGNPGLPRLITTTVRACRRR